MWTNLDYHTYISRIKVKYKCLSLLHAATTNAYKYGNAKFMLCTSMSYCIGGTNLFALS